MEQADDKVRSAISVQSCFATFFWLFRAFVSCAHLCIADSETELHKFDTFRVRCNESRCSVAWPCTSCSKSSNISSTWLGHHLAEQRQAQVVRHRLLHHRHNNVLEFETFLNFVFNYSLQKTIGTGKRRNKTSFKVQSQGKCISV